MKKREKKKWYKIRKKGEKQWIAYEVKPSTMRRLKPEYEYRGPFKTFLDCLLSNVTRSLKIKANKP